ncbi:MAG: NAD(P)H-hydrate dehydratase [Gammaproteobacteria bacterium]|nr:NAD(P)H-hydrate dehydratase [Gammaproteobacteria bacterium]
MTALPESLYRAGQLRELDRRAIEVAGIPGGELMERAGRAAFEALGRRWPGARRLAVLCGTGNNGGDGYVMARLARQAGLEVAVLALGDPGRLDGDALRAAEAWRASGGATEAFAPEALEAADVVVDALLGTGLERPVEGAWREAIEAVNRLGRPVLAVDMPSGLHADTGAVLGAAVRAQITVSFIGLKQGMFTGEGPEHCGQVVFDALKVPEEVYRASHPSARRIGPETLARLLPPRPRTVHKGCCGHVLVVGGDYGMAGAARMAGEAAARTGAGLVSVATRAEHVAVITGPRPELMCRGVGGARDLVSLLARADVVAIGPGLGRSPWAAELLGAVLDSRATLVVDADGLNLLAAEPSARGGWVLTPHPGEAARLLRCTADEVQADRFAAVEALAEAFGGVSVLKGAGTLVRAPQGQTCLCDAGNPGMASGGMGDVLTGAIAGFLAQGLGLEQAARAGVYAHAVAGDAAARAGGERGLLALDLMGPLRTLVNPVAAGDPGGDGPHGLAGV